MLQANSSRSKVLALLGIVAVVLLAESPAQSASTDKAVQSVTASSQSPDGVSSPVCPGPKMPGQLKASD